MKIDKLSEQSGIDWTAVNQYLEQQIEGFGKISEIDKFAVGQSNPTFRVRTNEGDFVLRRQPCGTLLKSAHAVDREYRVMAALASTDVPVPQMIHLCEDVDVLGSMFYLMSYVDGRQFTDPALPEIDRADKRPFYETAITTLAAIHKVDLQEVGLEDYGRGSNFFAWQTNLWSKQYRAAETETRLHMERLIEWLPQNLPQDDGRVTLIHGDYKFDNMLFHKHSPKVLAVLDWELSTLGHPIADLAYFCMCVRMPRMGILKGLGGVDRNEFGVPDEKELVDNYCELMQLNTIEDWSFYLAFSFFRLASISQGVYKRSIAGNASSKQAVLAGEVTNLLSAQAVELIN